MAAALPTGGVLMLENTRFHPEEEKNDLELAKQMGATVALNVKTGNLRDVQKQLGMREGFDVGLEMSGNPVAFHAMRGLAAHSNGFQTIRSLSILMSLLGTIDRPGGFRHKAPFPRPIPPCARTPNDPRAVQPNRPLDGMALGWPSDPDDLFVNDDGSPVRIDKAFSWEYPLSVHGLMHNVITNAWRGDPYRIDTLLIFMANMSWNSTMNTAEVRKMLNDKREDGEYKIPFLVVADAFHSEMTAFADLILPDTTYLERHDVMSMLDRPISEFDGPVDAVRIPVLPPSGECKPFQEVLIELGTRLKLPTFVTKDGRRKYRDYPDFIVNWETEPGSGIGFLAGWRGKGGEKFLIGEPNPRQWEMYEQHDCVYHHELPRSFQYMRNWNQGYLEWSRANRITRYAEPILIHLYSEVLQKFRLAAQGKGISRKPPEHLRERLATYFDPLPFYYEPLESQVTDRHKYPLAAVTQRPMAMYHSWDSQNAWLRQIHAHNHLFVNPGVARAAASGVAPGVHSGSSSSQRISPRSSPSTWIRACSRTRSRAGRLLHSSFGRPATSSAASPRRVAMRPGFESASPSLRPRRWRELMPATRLRSSSVRRRSEQSAHQRQTSQCSTGSG